MNSGCACSESNLFQEEIEGPSSFPYFLLSLLTNNDAWISITKLEVKS